MTHDSHRRILKKTTLLLFTDFIRGLGPCDLIVSYIRIQFLVLWLKNVSLWNAALDV